MKKKTDIEALALTYRNSQSGFILDKQQGFIAGYTACQEEDRWVPVSERLPDDSESRLSEPLLTIDSQGIMKVRQYNHALGHWMEPDRHRIITNFQPLPNPPKK